MTIDRSAARRGLVAGALALTTFASAAVAMTTGGSGNGLGTFARALNAAQAIVNAADGLHRGDGDGGRGGGPDG